MADQAKVTSIDAVEAFRASLILFAGKARNSLDEVGEEIRRARSWLQHEQRVHWEGEIRRRTKVLRQAEQELLSARMIKLLENLSSRQAAVHRARHALEESEEKLRHVKLWIRDYDSLLDPLARNLENLREYLAHDIPMGISYLSRVQDTLVEYSETRPVKPVEEAPVDLPGNH